MSGDKRHAPTGHSLFDHPCHGLFTGQIVGELSHRAYIGDGPIYCERCGTELDKNKNRKKGEPLHWEPRTYVTVGAVEFAQMLDALERLVTAEDNDPCWRDHNGLCQAHYLEEDCSMAHARDVLRKAGRL